MRIMQLVIIFLIFLTLIFLLFSISALTFYLKSINNKTDLLKNYSFTKAVCNSTNYCQDYEIVCNNGEIIKMSPISGAVVQFSKNWKDPRNIKQRSILCTAP